MKNELKALLILLGLAGRILITTSVVVILIVAIFGVLVIGFSMLRGIWMTYL